MANVEEAGRAVVKHCQLGAEDKLLPWVLCGVPPRRSWKMLARSRQLCCNFPFTSLNGISPWVGCFGSGLEVVISS